MNQFFYGRCSARPKITVELATGETTIIFATAKRPAGTKVEDPEEGVHGRNQADHDPPTHVTLYEVPGGTGQKDPVDPVTDWTLANTERAVQDGILVPFATGYLVKEWAVRTSNSEGDTTVERRFAIETILHKHKPLNEQALGIIAKNAAGMTLAVLATQADMVETPAKAPKNKKAKDAAQADLFNQPAKEVESPDQALQDQGAPQGSNVEGFSQPDPKPIDHEHVTEPEIPGNVTMLDRARSARKTTPKFSPLPRNDNEDLDLWIERSIAASGCLRVRLVLLASVLNVPLAELKTCIDNSNMLGCNPNGTVFSKLDAALNTEPETASQEG